MQARTVTVRLPASEQPLEQPADAISALANRLNELEELVAEQTGRKPTAEVRPLRRRGGPDSAGG